MNKGNIKRNKASIRIIKELEDSMAPNILAKQIVIRGENIKIFNDFVLKIRKENPISSEIEKEFLKKYIFSAWKLERMRILEKIFLNRQQTEPKGYDFISSSDGKKKRIRSLSKIEINDDLNRIFLLQSSLEKQMVKALKQLREEQNRNLLKNKVN